MCSKCQGLMVLEDQGEFLEALDVMSLFEYRCRACGHLERSEKGALHVETKDQLDDRGTIPPAGRNGIPALRVHPSKAVRENC